MLVALFALRILAHETAGAARTRLSLRSLFQRGTRASSSTDLPDGQISKNLSSPLDKNILLFFEAKSPAYLSTSLAHKRGVSRSSRTLGWDAVDATALLTNGANADGEVVWS